MQELKTNITIQIPDTHILIEKVELEELKQQAEPEWVSGLRWLSEQTSIKDNQQLKDKILYPYKNELSDFIDYPQSSGEVWRFNVSETKKWLRNNFSKVVKR
jgi:phage pi2 protein 07